MKKTATIPTPAFTRRRLLATGASAATTLALGGCLTPDEPQMNVESDPDLVKITLVHINDIHGTWNPDAEGSTPLGRVRAYYQQALADNPNTLFTNGGDDFEKGSVIEFVSEGEAVLQVTQAMKFDVRVIGNHDFAWSEEMVLRHSNDAHGDVICSNVSYKGSSSTPYGAKRYVIREVGGVRIGFFGTVTFPYNELNESYIGDFYPAFPMQTDFFASIQSVIEEIKDEVDLLVLISHMGLEADQIILSAYKDIDIVLSAHSHSLYADAFADGWIIQTGSNSRFVGRIDLTYQISSASIVELQHILVENTPTAIPESDPEIDTLVAALIAQYGLQYLEPVGHISTDLDLAGTAQLVATACQQILQVDAAGSWTGSLGALPGGPVSAQTFSDHILVERQPAGTPGWTSIYSLEITGAQLLQMVSAADDSEWRWALPTTEIVSDTVYTVALSKGPAFNPDKFFGSKLSFANIEAQSEVWSILYQYGQVRTQAGLHMDVDTVVG